MHLCTRKQVANCIVLGIEKYGGEIVVLALPFASKVDEVSVVLVLRPGAFSHSFFALLTRESEREAKLEHGCDCCDDDGLYNPRAFPVLVQVLVSPLAQPHVDEVEQSTEQATDYPKYYHGQELVQPVLVLGVIDVENDEPARPKEPAAILAHLHELPDGDTDNGCGEEGAPSKLWPPEGSNLLNREQNAANRSTESSRYASTCTARDEIPSVPVILELAKPACIELELGGPSLRKEGGNTGTSVHQRTLLTDRQTTRDAANAPHNLANKGAEEQHARQIHSVKIALDFRDATPRRCGSKVRDNVGTRRHQQDVNRQVADESQDVRLGHGRECPAEL
mmetsp:Transcript_14767/g.37558  ORF Transcript_14767/g.37558 Transcript_14767/m.37558 type:complete len:337 (-) Transcript_14767:500-1510(-)